MVISEVDGLCMVNRNASCDDLLSLIELVCQCEADGYGHSAEPVRQENGTPKRQHWGTEKSLKGAFAANLLDK